MRILDAVREWGGWRDRRRGPTVTSRVTLPAVVDPAPDVLRHLKALHESFDLYHLPDGRVWLLRYQEDRARIGEGRKELEQAKAIGWDEPMYSAQLMAAGFALWGEIAKEDHELGQSSGYMVGLAAQKFRATEHDVRDAMLYRRAIADSTAQKEEMTRVLRDRIRSSARGDWARTWRGRKVFARSY